MKKNILTNFTSRTSSLLLLGVMIFWATSVSGQWTETFDNTSLPAGWTNASSTGSTSTNALWKFSGNPGYAMFGTADHTGNGGSYAWVDGSFPSGLTSILTSPTVSLAGYVNPELRFWIKSDIGTNNTTFNTFSVDFYDGAAWNVGVFTFANNTANSDWEQFSVSLTGYTITGPVQFRFNLGQFGSTAFYNDVTLDDIEVVSVLNNDAGATAVLNPTLPGCVVDSVVTVEIKNFGASALTSATVNWSVNGTLQTPYSWTGNLAQNTMDSVTLSTSASINFGDTIDIWTSNPNGVTDSAAVNDSTQLIYIAGYNGTYTIDPSGNGDFTSFTDALNNVAIYGLCGPTRMEAVDSLYTEQLNIELYQGMDMNNWLTFASQSGNADNVILEWISSGSADNYTVNFDEAAYVKFENMTIRNNGTTYSRVITTPTSGGTHHVEFRGCVLQNSPSTSTSTFRAVAYIYGTGNDNWVFEDNMFINGSYGLYLYGNFSSNNMNNVVKGNTMMNNYYRGAYYYYQMDGMFSDNTTYSNATYSFATGFYLGQLNGCEVSNNLVQGSSTWPRYGIYMVTAQGDLQTFMPVYNNRVILRATNALYGIYISNNLFVEYAHNSVYMEGTSASSYACYFTSGSYNTLKNNIFQHMGAGYGIYLNGTGIYQSDYNNISTPNGNAGFAGGAQATLADWQLATGFDSNSIVVNNVITDTATFKVCNDSLYAMGTPLSAYPMDMDGDMRNNPPCIGADEFLPISMFGFNTNPVLCDGDTLTLVQDYYDTVVWNTTDTSNMYQVSAPGTQTVSVYDLCGSDTSVFTVDPQTFAHIGDTNLCEGTMATLETGISNGTYLWSNGSTDSTIMVDSAQVVSVDVIDAFGCESSDTAFVTQSFDVVLPDSTTFCEGSSVVLDANMQGTYLWSDGSTNQTLAVSSSGTYSVTVTDQNCVSSSTSNVTEILDAIPAFDDSSSYLTVAFENLSQNATAYEWDFGDGSPISTDENPIHVYPWTGADSINYTVILTAYNSCGQDDFINDGVRVGQLVSVTDIDLASMINVFPNPSNGQFNVSLQTPDAGDLEIRVVDVTGALVYNQSFGMVNGDVNREINLENTASGIYFVQVTLGNETAVFRLTVE